jgi:hypothetical protein
VSVIFIGPSSRKVFQRLSGCGLRLAATVKPGYAMSQYSRILEKQSRGAVGPWGQVADESLASQVTEKVEFACSGWEEHPSGAKARANIAALAARLKPSPFKTAAQQEFFRSL